jgi:hypothetical protein
MEAGFLGQAAVAVVVAVVVGFITVPMHCNWKADSPSVCANTASLPLMGRRGGLPVA